MALARPSGEDIKHANLYIKGGRDMNSKEWRYRFSVPPKRLDFYSLSRYSLYTSAGIPKDMNKDQLFDLFKPFGEIIQSKILVDQYTGFSKGAGFILFRCQKLAQFPLVNENFTIVGFCSAKTHARTHTYTHSLSTHT